MKRCKSLLLGLFCSLLLVGCDMADKRKQKAIAIVEQYKTERRKALETAIRDEAKVVERYSAGSLSSGRSGRLKNIPSRLARELNFYEKMDKFPLVHGEEGPEAVRLVQSYLESEVGLWKATIEFIEVETGLARQFVIAFNRVLSEGQGTPSLVRQVIAEQEEVVEKNQIGVAAAQNILQLLDKSQKELNLLSQK